MSYWIDRARIAEAEVERLTKEVSRQRDLADLSVIPVVDFTQVNALTAEVERLRAACALSRPDVPTMGGIKIITDCRVPLNGWLNPGSGVGPHTCTKTKPCDMRPESLCDDVDPLRHVGLIESNGDLHICKPDCHARVSTI